MTTSYIKLTTKTGSLERAFAAGDIEKIFPQGPESACLTRLLRARGQGQE